MYIFKYRLYYIYYYLFCIHSIFLYIYRVVYLQVCKFGFGDKKAGGGEWGEETWTLWICRMQVEAKPCWVQIVSWDVVIFVIALVKISPWFSLVFPWFSTMKTRRNWWKPWKNRWKTWKSRWKPWRNWWNSLKNRWPPWEKSENHQEIEGKNKCQKPKTKSQASGPKK